MASRAYQVEPLDVLLASIPSLPRPILARLTARMIERLDEIDGEPDAEDDDPAEDNGDLEGIDEREPEDWIGGGGNECTRGLVHPIAPRRREPNPELARIKRQLRRMRGGARTH